MPTDNKAAGAALRTFLQGALKRSPRKPTTVVLHDPRDDEKRRVGEQIRNQLLGVQPDDEQEGDDQ